MRAIKISLLVVCSLFAAPNNPANLKLTPLSSHSVSIQWTDNLKQPMIRNQSNMIHQ